jgi:hypothetical protein
MNTIHIQFWGSCSHWYDLYTLKHYCKPSNTFGIIRYAIGSIQYQRIQWKTVDPNRHTIREQREQIGNYYVSIADLS